MDIMRRQSIQNLPIKITDMENTTRWEKFYLIQHRGFTWEHPV